MSLQPTIKGLVARTIAPEAVSAWTKVVCVASIGLVHCYHSAWDSLLLSSAAAGDEDPGANVDALPSSKKLAEVVRLLHESRDSAMRELEGVT